jgi:response regulator RpfG family c-di-GMP phosphodiesterase
LVKSSLRKEIPILYSYTIKTTLKSASFNSSESILLLDDEFDITTVLKQGIQKQGFQVFGFTDPLLALEHFQINSKQYSLVISDLRMPGMNGYEFVKKVKEIKPKVLVFLMTAFEINDIEFHRLLQSVKIDEFIQKPVSFKDLALMISKHINAQIKADT